MTDTKNCLATNINAKDWLHQEFLFLCLYTTINDDTSCIHNNRILEDRKAKALRTRRRAHGQIDGRTDGQKEGWAEGKTPFCRVALSLLIL